MLTYWEPLAAVTTKSYSLQYQQSVKNGLQLALELARCIGRPPGLPFADYSLSDTLHVIQTCVRANGRQQCNRLVIVLQQVIQFSHNC
jgi:hypothetical protein